jgi:hypothetical protein
MSLKIRFIHTVVFQCHETIDFCSTVRYSERLHSKIAESGTSFIDYPLPSRRMCLKLLDHFVRSRTGQWHSLVWRKYNGFSEQDSTVFGKHGVNTAQSTFCYVKVTKSPEGNKSRDRFDLWSVKSTALCETSRAWDFFSRISGSSNVPSIDFC